MNTDPSQNVWDESSQTLIPQFRWVTFGHVLFPPWIQVWCYDITQWSGEGAGAITQQWSPFYSEDFVYGSLTNPQPDGAPNKFNTRAEVVLVIEAILTVMRKVLALIVDSKYQLMDAQDNVAGALGAGVGAGLGGGGGGGGAGGTSSGGGADLSPETSPEVAQGLAAVAQMIEISLQINDAALVTINAVNEAGVAGIAASLSSTPEQAAVAVAAMNAALNDAHNSVTNGQGLFGAMLDVASGVKLFAGDAPRSGGAVVGGAGAGVGGLSAIDTPSVQGIIGQAIADMNAAVNSATADNAAANTSLSLTLGLSVVSTATVADGIAADDGSW